MILAGMAVLIALVAIRYWQSRETDRLIASIEMIPFQTLIADEESAEDANVDSPIPEGSAVGILEIDKIDLKVPIVEGVQAEHLRSAVGHLPESGSLGSSDQNFVVAGHRSSVWGKFFNRLDELTEGDEFVIRGRNGLFTFRITEKRVVDPYDLDAIQPVAGKRMATLVTCHPFRSNKQRLLVFGEMVKQTGTLSASLQNKAAAVHAPVNIAAKPHFGISIHRSEGDGK